jgi:hypothetical protein
MVGYNPRIFFDNGLTEAFGGGGVDRLVSPKWDNVGSQFFSHGHFPVETRMKTAATTSEMEAPMASSASKIMVICSNSGRECAGLVWVNQLKCRPQNRPQRRLDRLGEDRQQPFRGLCS